MPLYERTPDRLASEVDIRAAAGRNPVAGNVIRIKEATGYVVGIQVTSSNNVPSLTVWVCQAG